MEIMQLRVSFIVPHFDTKILGFDGTVIEWSPVWMMMRLNSYAP